jgi:hypothetical protein
MSTNSDHPKLITKAQHHVQNMVTVRRILKRMSRKRVDDRIFVMKSNRMMTFKHVKKMR